MKFNLPVATALLAASVFSMSLSSVVCAQEANGEASPVPFQTVVRIAPENTRIEFVGTHVGEDPKPRLGGFSKFDGMIGVDLEKKSVTSLNVEMEIGSIWTEFDKLTTHLMNADFFETEKFPSARFKSTKIMTLQNGTCNIVGQLTLHGETSEVMFPASYKFEETGLVLTAQFFLDRTKFGMDKMTDGVEPMVSINVVVGSPTKTAESSDGNGSKSGEQTSTDGETPTGMTVTVKLPNMVWSGCEASVRSQLKSIEQIYKFETDLDEKTATIVFDPNLDISETLDALVEKCDKIKDWSFQ